MNSVNQAWIQQNQATSSDIQHHQGKILGETSAMVVSTALASTAISAIYTSYNAAAIRLQANIMMQVTAIEAFNQMMDVTVSHQKSQKWLRN